MITKPEWQQADKRSAALANRFAMKIRNGKRLAVEDLADERHEAAAAVRLSLQEAARFWVKHQGGEGALTW